VASEAARRRFKELALPHLDDAYSLARWLAGDASDAEDIVQDALLRVLNARDDVKVDHPRAWVLTIVRNAAYSWLAKNRPRAILAVGGAEDAEAHPDALAMNAAPSAEEALIASADRERVTQAIAELPLPLRETLVLREINDLTYREIAATQNIPVGTVMSRLARARAQLVAKLGTPA
jgi:RNA polymerase sigma factor (sigma-70 family)